MEEKSLELSLEERRKLDNFIHIVVVNGDYHESYYFKSKRDLNKWINLVYGDFIEEDEIYIYSITRKPCFHEVLIKTIKNNPIRF